MNIFYKILKMAFAGILLVVVNTALQAQTYPKPIGYVNDFAEQLTPEQRTDLNNKLIALEDTTGIEVAVVTVTSLDGLSVEGYTQSLATEWGVGKKGKDNGIVFLVAPNQRKIRIEIASGIATVFTSSDADLIRDQNVIPNFKKGDMAQGIIEGTEAIIKFFDPNIRAAEAKQRSIDMEIRRRESERNSTILAIIFGSIFGLFIIIRLVVGLVHILKSPAYVLSKRTELAKTFAEAEKKAKNLDVKDETRKDLAKLKKEFSKIEQLDRNSTGVKWVKIREEVDLMIDESLPAIISAIEKDINFAKKARKEGPKLMEKLPDLIDAAEKKLEKGEGSKEAKRYIRKAKEQYLNAQNQHSGMTMVDWVLLYVLLSESKSNVAGAIDAHSYSNTSSRSSSGTSVNFGNNNGFGGGGGFGGSGSSGTW